MAAAAVSAADAACVARVPALLEALRKGFLVLRGGDKSDDEDDDDSDDDDDDDDDVVVARSHELQKILAGEPNAPAHPAALAALLSAGLVPLLLSLCTTEARAKTCQEVCRALLSALRVSEAARDQVGLAGFCQLLDVAERDASSVHIATVVLSWTSISTTMMTAVCGEVGTPTLQRVLVLCDRSASTAAFTTLRYLLSDAALAQSAIQGLFNNGFVAWLAKHLRHFFLIAPDAALVIILLHVCHSLLATRDGREAMRLLYHHFGDCAILSVTSPCRGSCC